MRHHIAAFAPNCFFFDVHQEVLFTEAKLNAKMLSSAHVVLMTPFRSSGFDDPDTDVFEVIEAVLSSAQDCQAQELMLVGQAVALQALEALALMLGSAPWLCAVTLRRGSLSSS